MYATIYLMQLANKDNLEGALLELIRRKELPKKLLLHLTKNPTVKLAFANNKPITDDVVSSVAEQLVGNAYYKLPHKTSKDIARQIKTRMQWKQIENALSKAQTQPIRTGNTKPTHSPSDRRPIIPLAV